MRILTNTGYFALAIIVGLVTAGIVKAGELEDKWKPRLQVAGGVGFPVLDSEFGDAGGYVNIAGSVQNAAELTEYIQLDLLEVNFWTGTQEETVWGYPVDYDSNVLALGPAVRIGDFRNCKRWQPYVIAGIGAARTKFSAYGYEWDDWGVQGSIGLGLNVNFGNDVPFNVGVKYRAFITGNELLEDLYGKRRAALHTLAFEVAIK
jgi:hypothetical protein